MAVPGRKHTTFPIATGPLSAGLIHVSMTAEISWTDPGGPFAGASGTVTAEATFADSGVETVGYYQAYDDAGFYEMSGAPISIGYNLGEPGEFNWFGTEIGIVQQDNLGIEVSDGHWNPSRDDIYLTTKYNSEIYYMIFSGPAGSLESDDIPDVGTLNTFYDSASIWVTGSFTGEPFWIGATATEVTFSALAVPLPASVWLLLSGVAGFGVFARTRRSL